MTHDPAGFNGGGAGAAHGRGYPAASGLIGRRIRPSSACSMSSRPSRMASTAAEIGISSAVRRCEAGDRARR